MRMFLFRVRVRRTERLAADLVLRLRQAAERREDLGREAYSTLTFRVTRRAVRRVVERFLLLVLLVALRAIGLRAVRL